MQSEAVILVLEDEKPQLLALRGTLEGIGELQEFSDPSPALTFLQTHRADVAIIDVHMPRFEMNGLEFIKEVRKFDSELCIIIRTGDDSTEVADTAIELRAYRRAIKSKISVDELRELTRAAIAETRERRNVATNAATTRGVRTELVKTLGSVEEELSASECYKGLLQTLRNQLTALSGTAEVLVEAAQRNNLEMVKEQARQNRLCVGRVVSELNSFLDGPFAESLRAPKDVARASVNGVVGALNKAFSASATWEAQQKSFFALELSGDIYVAAHSLRLITALRHLVEYCLQRAAPRTQIRLTTRCLENVKQGIDAVDAPKLVFNGRLVNSAYLCVGYRLLAPLLNTTLEDIRRSFHEYPEDSRMGNLQMLGIALGSKQAVLMVHNAPGQMTVFELYVPVSR